MTLIYPYNTLKKRNLREIIKEKDEQIIKLNIALKKAIPIRGPSLMSIIEQQERYKNDTCARYYSIQIYIIWVYLH